ncbi:MAG: hypothetical protein ABIH67_03065 [Candidatus Uhrbacteria bacterium]
MPDCLPIFIRTGANAREPRWISIKEIRPEQFSGPWMWKAVKTACHEEGYEHLLYNQP